MSGTAVEWKSVIFFFSSRRRHTRYWRDWSSDVCSSDLDGHSTEYQRGNFAKTRIDVTGGERKTLHFHREGEYQDTVEQLFLRLVSKEKGAYWCTLADRKLPRFIVRDASDEAEEGWYYNMTDRSVWIKCRKPQARDFDIVVSTEKFGLVGMVLDEDA